MNPGITKRFLFFLSALSLFAGGVAFANIDITLDNAFIDKFSDRVTIDASFTVDKAHVRANSPKDDGDLHIAGRAAEVKLAMVAEIMNAASQQPAVDAVHQAERGPERTLPVTGVWRLWCEHGGESEQIQGKALSPARFTTTNPPHVFQIHPITKIAAKSIVDSIHPVEGYKAKDAETAFTRYEALRCHMSVSSKKTTLTTTMAGYNYVEFICRPTGKPKQLQDGTAVFAEARTLDDELLVRNRRMLFVKDSAAEQALKSLGENQELHVLGIPRISLKLVAYRRDHASTNRNMLDWGLPYEIVIVGSAETRAVPE